MSSYVYKYKIVYDGNDGMTYDENIYCKYEGVWDGQLWANEDGTPVDFRCLTDSAAKVKSMCIAGIPTDDKYFYWKEIEEFELPDAVAEAFDYKSGLKIANKRHE